MKAAELFFFSPWKKSDQNNSEYGHFSRSANFCRYSPNDLKISGNVVPIKPSKVYKNIND